MNAQKRKTKGTPSSIDVHVGKRLRFCRSRLQLSQEKLAEAIGVTFQQIQKYEKGMNRISAGRLYQFSRILKVPVSYFFENLSESNENKQSFGFADNDQDAFISDDMMNNKETLELIRVYYAEEDPKKRKDIIKFMKLMTQKD